MLNFIIKEAPKSGSATEIADGVFWLRFDLPMKGLDHINLWALRDEDEWVVVDTGIGNKASKSVWLNHFSTLMKGQSVNRVVCTHLHPDHTGLAGWICKKFDAPLLMTRDEYFLCRLMAADTGQVAPSEGISYYKKAGFTDQQIELYKTRFGGFGKAITALPHSYNRLIENDKIVINNRDWQVIIGSGHSPEHACLYNQELNLCLTGDQLLPNISSNVSVWPTEPNSNPLEEWISSCKHLKSRLPEDVLIAPAHGLPFTGAHRRLDRLVEHHEKALDRLLKYCSTPRLSTEVYSVLFRRKIDDGNRMMAVGEAIAHLNCLSYRGLISRKYNSEGQFVYTAMG